MNVAERSALANARGWTTEAEVILEAFVDGDISHDDFIKEMGEVLGAIDRNLSQVG